MKGLSGKLALQKLPMNADDTPAISDTSSTQSRCNKGNVKNMESRATHLETKLPLSDFNTTWNQTTNQPLAAWPCKES